MNAIRLVRGGGAGVRVGVGVVVGVADGNGVAAGVLDGVGVIVAADTSGGTMPQFGLALLGATCYTFVNARWGAGE